jgi:DNA-binding beta-propeller fold protein YncE
VTARVIARATSSRSRNSVATWRTQRSLAIITFDEDAQDHQHPAGAPLNAGAYTYPTAITMAGQTAVVVEPYGYTVTLIDTKTGRVYSPVTVGSYPVAAAITG